MFSTLRKNVYRSHKDLGYFFQILNAPPTHPSKQPSQVCEWNTHKMSDGFTAEEVAVLDRVRILTSQYSEYKRMSRAHGALSRMSAKVVSLIGDGRVRELVEHLSAPSSAQPSATATHTTPSQTLLDAVRTLTLSCLPFEKLDAVFHGYFADEKCILAGHLDTTQGTDAVLRLLLQQVASTNVSTTHLSCTVQLDREESELSHLSGTKRVTRLTASGTTTAGEVQINHAAPFRFQRTTESEVRLSAETLGALFGTACHSLTLTKEPEVEVSFSPSGQIQHEYVRRRRTANYLTRHPTQPTLVNKVFERMPAFQGGPELRKQPDPDRVALQYTVYRDVRCEGGGGSGSAQPYHLVAQCIDYRFAPGGTFVAEKREERKKVHPQHTKPVNNDMVHPHIQHSPRTEVQRSPRVMHAAVDADAVQVQLPPAQPLHPPFRFVRERERSEVQAEVVFNSRQATPPRMEATSVLNAGISLNDAVWRANSNNNATTQPTFKDTASDVITVPKAARREKGWGVGVVPIASNKRRLESRVTTVRTPEMQAAAAPAPLSPPTTPPTEHLLSPARPHSAHRGAEVASGVQERNRSPPRSPPPRDASPRDAVEREVSQLWRGDAGADRALLSDAYWGARQGRRSLFSNQATCVLMAAFSLREKLFARLPDSCGQHLALGGALLLPCDVILKVVRYLSPWDICAVANLSIEWRAVALSAAKRSLREASRPRPILDTALVAGTRSTLAAKPRHLSAMY